MDAVLLAKIQFGFTAGFHFLFPPTTFGLTLVILIFESLYLRSKDELFKRISSFLIRILAVIFVMGVSTGIVLEFAFGNNWAEYSRMVGDIFGAPLAAEGVFAFFLESVFLGILVFGRARVSKKAYWWSAFLVFFGSHLSGVWIIIANSWMQTPAGYKIEGGRAVLTNFFQAALNHSTIERYLHTAAAGWITGSLVAAAIAAWYILKKRDEKIARPLLRVSLIIFIGISLLQLGLGHAHSVQVAKTQPEKMAAFEALWETEEGAPFAVFGIPDGAEQKTNAYIGIPKFLSFLIHFNTKSEVLGLNEFPREEQPPVFIPFVSYHLMILLGMIFILVSLIGLILLIKKRIYDTRWFLKLLIFLLPLPYVANETGWIAAEVGRQPWAVFKVLRTADAVSVNVPAGNILLSLILFALVYTLIAVIGLSVILRLIRKGPEDTTSGEY
ncbi:MAG: cytochrome ubiquinol oxidase subunit I [Candidatus Aminicenantes bacterium]|nr:cytochrome ubiquinol oxidase subunit I [Candidatus Aminicenantes bacterium]